MPGMSPDQVEADMSSNAQLMTTTEATGWPLPTTRRLHRYDAVKPTATLLAELFDTLFTLLKRFLQ